MYDGLYWVSLPILRCPNRRHGLVLFSFVAIVVEDADCGIGTGTCFIC